ncbi:AEC family transporter [Acuticoccus sp. I52.16.1]|uniref:AEC family transporter n=1 Tax=Acuticoccus sp. I52.16.1 TaxID=2928472 RepID=UPI001FD156A6|nr:AEC family transporter [Acuticoccus sp. I52.16.1]UOM36036.1 AEC family transporter [Acuticoccus sp. I52.16.1]
MAFGLLAATVLPVFGFIAIGYLTIVLRVLREEVADHLSNFVFTLGIPLLLIRAIGTMELPDISPWPFWGVYFSSVLINIAIGVVITERAFKRDARAGVIGGMSASFSNLVMVGLPLMTQAFGEQGLVTAFFLISVHLPFMMTVSALLIEVAEYRDGSAAGRLNLFAAVGRVARQLIKNPLVIGILIGVAVRVTGLPIVGVPRTLVDGLADTAIPLALVALGMALPRFGLRGTVAPAIVLSVVKLMVMPAVVYLLAVHVVALPPLPAAVLVLSAACPTGVNAYLIANRFQTGLALSANTITLTTAGSIVSFMFWLALVVE